MRLNSPDCDEPTSDSNNLDYNNNDWEKMHSPMTHKKIEESCLTPLNSLRLRPIRQRTRNAIVNILNNGDVCLEFLKLRNPIPYVSEVMSISANGLMVMVYRPPRDTMKPASVEDGPVLIPDNSISYPLKSLPRKYWKKYSYASRFVQMVKSKTPKVTYFSDMAKCMLMESDGQFEVVFYSGPKFTVSTEEVRVIDTTGMNICFNTESESSLLSGEVYTMWQHVKKCTEHCLAIEQLLTSSELPAHGSHSNFPVIVGNRWSADLNHLNCYNEASDPKSDQENITPELSSFDESIISHNTTLNTSIQPNKFRGGRTGQAVPIPTSPPSVTASTDAACIVLRRHIKNIGWANHMSNGAVCVQFDDGYQITVYAHKSEVMFVFRNGVVSRYSEADAIPDIVRKKLENLIQVVNSLALQ